MFIIHFNKRARYAQPNRSHLSRPPTTINIDSQIEFPGGLRDLKWLDNIRAQSFERKVFLQ
jgi:hypothetical protein